MVPSTAKIQPPSENDDIYEDDDIDAELKVIQLEFLHFLSEDFPHEVKN
jgi:hypothetical protein